MKYDDVKIDGQNIFDWKEKTDLRVDENIQKITRIPTDQGDPYIAGCLSDYPYVKENHRLIAADLSKQQGLNADPKTIRHINFTGNLHRGGGAKMFFLMEEVFLDFSQETLEVL